MGVLLVGLNTERIGPIGANPCAAAIAIFPTGVGGKPTSHDERAADLGFTREANRERPGYACRE
jgi:hypothetical protein